MTWYHTNYVKHNAKRVGNWATAGVLFIILSQIHAARGWQPLAIGLQSAGKPSYTSPRPQGLGGVVQKEENHVFLFGCEHYYKIRKNILASMMIMIDYILIYGMSSQVK